MTLPARSTSVEQGYELIDAGQGRRLERFGSHVIDRPAPGADFPAGAPERWAEADLSWDRDGGWLRETPGAGDGDHAGRPVPADASATPPGAAGAREPSIDPWTMAVDGLALELRATASGGVGLYPEHRINLPWLVARIGERVGRDEAPRVLNLFAHTGLVTLAAARAGAAVTHVDAARGVVAWARRNAELSALADGPIRWIVDDAAAFVAREARRGRRYDGIVLDPPSFGHARGRRWRLADQLPELLGACRAVAGDDAFLLMTAHTAGLDPADLAAAVHAAFPSRSARANGLALALDLRADSGITLELGCAVRLPG
jgi:23S rRNA (cytosine1962-C5)-methyltransferase